MPIETLLNRQNPDGGWPYTRGSSWTEPTVYAMLALLAAGEREKVAAGVRWIQSASRADGGWAPRQGVEESTWVTSLVALLPSNMLGRQFHQRAIAWLLQTSGQESSFTNRLRAFLRGVQLPKDWKFAGWPWVPETAAWTTPTSLAILALRQAARQGSWPGLAERLEAGKQYLLTHACRDGGWNYGAPEALGYAAQPYPETTGIALTALAGVKSPKVDRAVDMALQFLKDCRSADALNWLHLGLAAHGRWPSDFSPAPLEYRTTPEIALGMLAAGSGSPLIEA
jgi:Prenyltransferase and squalene oxidase repeat